MYSIFNRCLSVRGRCGIVCGLFVCSPLSSKPVHYKTLKLTNRKLILHQKCVKSLVSNFFFNFSLKSILLGEIQAMVKIDKFFQVLLVNYVSARHLWLESIFVLNFSKQYIHLSHHHLPCSNHAAPTTVSS